MTRCDRAGCSKQALVRLTDFRSLCLDHWVAEATGPARETIRARKGSA